MSGYSDYFAWLEHGRWIRVSVRAIIFNRAKDEILLERDTSHQNDHINFIGGGLEIGETLQAGIERELNEETDAAITAVRHLFVVENFIRHGAEVRHSLEHYFEIGLASEKVVPRETGHQLSWVPIAELAAMDLRPVAVRDAVAEGRWDRVDHLVDELDA